MVQLLTVKYNKEEERVLLISNLSGVFIGIPTGVLLGYLIGFFNVNLVTASSIGLTVFCLKIGSIIVPICWTMTIAICLLLCKKRRDVNSMKAGRMILGTSVFPLAVAYGFLVTGLVFLPLGDYLLQYLHRPVLVVLVSELTSIPFVIIIIAILLPETPAGKALRQFVRRSRKHRKN